jgi:hypothetical protein
MGRDITILGQHKLPFNDVNSLMQKLSDTFNANLYYGFESYINLDEHLEKINWPPPEDPDEDDISAYLLSKIEKDISLPNALLLNDDYMYTWLYNKFGDEAGNLPEFKKTWTQSPEQNNKFIQDFMNDPKFFEFIVNDYKLNIYKESICPSINMNYMRWWGFFSLVLHDDRADEREYLLKSMNRIKELVKLVGGNSAYYLDDQSNVLQGIGCMNEIDMDWGRIESEIETLVGKEKIINLRKVLVDESYRKYIQEISKENETDFPAFYDDFSE